MADESGNQNYLRSVTSVSEDDFAEFLRVKGVKMDCLFCGGEVTVQKDGKTRTSGWVFATTIPPSVDSIVVQYVFGTKCNNCGNMQMYDREDIGKWKTDQN